MDTKQLKQKILDLAIRGKLVPQDPKDEPASVLLERIRKEKEQLIASGKLKKSKSKTTDTPHYENVPFEIPDSWEWVRLEDICEINLGLTHTPSYVEDGIPFVSAKDISSSLLDLTNTKRISKSEFATFPYGAKPHKGDVLFCRVGTIGHPQIVITEEPFGIFVSVGFLRITNKDISNKYLKYWMESPLFYNQVESDVKGATRKNLNTGWLKDFYIPIPPLNEQVRIVRSIQSYFALLYEIEAHKSDLQDYIKTTKSKVLDLAIHGKLVPQDPNDEPAIALLRRINPHFTPCDTSHYENLPNGWTICSLSDIAKITAGGTPSRKMISYWDGGTIPWLKIADMTTSGKYVRSASEYITEEGMKNSSAKLMKKGTLLYTIFASIGEVAILDFEATCNQAIANIDLYIPEMTDYIYYFLKNLQAYMYSISKGCTQLNINQGILKSVTIPLPPLSEQKRIVERIETILAQLDTITAEL